MYESTVRAMSEAERAEALVYAERARARAFPVWWRRLAYAVIAFGLMKAGSLVCCVPTVGGVLAMFGVRNTWVELGLLAALAVGIGWLVATMRDRESRERTEHFVRVAKDVEAGEVREVRWRASRAWIACHEGVGGDVSSIAYRLGQDDFLLYPAVGEVTSNGRLWPGSRNEQQVAHSVRAVLLPASGVLLVDSSTFEDWHAVRCIEWVVNGDEWKSAEFGDDAWLVVHRDEIDADVRAQVDAEIEVDSAPPTPRDGPSMLGHGHAVVKALGFIAGTIAAGAAAGFLLGLVIGRNIDAAARMAVVAAICIAVAYLILGIAIGGVVGGVSVVTWIARRLDPDSAESANGGPSAWTESFDAERVELITRSPGGKVIGASWHTQGLVYRVPVKLLDAEALDGRPRRRVRVRFESTSEGEIASALEHIGEPIACSSSVMKRDEARRTFVCRGAEVASAAR